MLCSSPLSEIAFVGGQQVIRAMDIDQSNAIRHADSPERVICLGFVFLILLIDIHCDF